MFDVELLEINETLVQEGLRFRREQAEVERQAAEEAKSVSLKAQARPAEQKRTLDDNSSNSSSSDSESSGARKRRKRAKKEKKRKRHDKKEKKNKKKKSKKDEK